MSFVEASLFEESLKSHLIAWVVKSIESFVQYLDLFEPGHIMFEEIAIASVTILSASVPCFDQLQSLAVATASAQPLVQLVSLHIAIAIMEPVLARLQVEPSLTVKAATIS